MSVKQICKTCGRAKWTTGGSIIPSYECPQCRAVALFVPIGAWVEDGLCREIGGDAWYPTTGESDKEAIAVCYRCPVRRDCLEWALANREEWGIWGGLRPQEREKRLRIERASAPDGDAA